MEDGKYIKQTELEKEFVSVSDKFHNEIKKHLKDAREALKKAIDLSEEYGIPFESPISFLCNSYIPSSLHGKFGDIDKDFVAEITGVYNEYDSDGWEHSAVC